MTKLTESKLKGVFSIRLDLFEDFRGQYVEIYNEDLYKKNGVKVKFVQDDISISRKNVLRGIHGDNKTWKLISCLFGSFYLVVVNCDKKSKEFGKWASFTLSDVNRLQVLVPPMFGNAHFILSDIAIFHYKQSTYYDPKSQFTYKWNDSQFNIWWPVKNPIISQRDEQGEFVE